MRASARRGFGLLVMLVCAALLVCAAQNSAIAIHVPSGRPTVAEPLDAPFDELAARRMQIAWAVHLKCKAIEANTIGIDLALIPPGTFLMGGSESLPELARTFPILEIDARNAGVKSRLESERPQHKVRITKPFYLGKYNVTRAQFAKFVENTGYRTEAEVDGRGGSGYTEHENPRIGVKPAFNWRNTGFPQQDDSPVVNISWNDATLFCRWLSKKEGKTYRLPTEAEWEYACRAGTTTRYSTGDSPNGLVEVANVADVAFFTMADGGQLSPESADRGRVMGTMLNGDDRFVFTSPVGKFKPNAFGLGDMHGNASTWCLDWYVANYYANSPVDDPRGPASGTERRCRRGLAIQSGQLPVGGSFGIPTVRARCICRPARRLRVAVSRSARCATQLPSGKKCAAKGSAGEIERANFLAFATISPVAPWPHPSRFVKKHFVWPCESQFSSEPTSW